MLNTRILKHPVIVQTETQLWGNHEQGWSHNLDTLGTLPNFNDLVKKLPAGIWDQGKAALFLPEIACFPLKVDMAHKVSLKERENYMKWNLKKRLPFPSEDAIIRFLPLGDSSTWLVFSLPGSWVKETYAFFKEKGVQLGYIGTISGLFLERLRARTARLLLAFHNYYAFIQKDNGHITHFKLRRFPEDGGQILFPEFFPSDFSSGPQDGPLDVISFSETRNVEWSMFRSQQPSLVEDLKSTEGNLAQFLASLGRNA